MQIIVFGLTTCFSLFWSSLAYHALFSSSAVQRFPKPIFRRICLTRSGVLITTPRLGLFQTSVRNSSSIFWHQNASRMFTPSVRQGSYTQTVHHVGRWESRRPFFVPQKKVMESSKLSTQSHSSCWKYVWVCLKIVAKPQKMVGSSSSSYVSSFFFLLLFHGVVYFLSKNSGKKIQQGPNKVGEGIRRICL